MSLKRPSSVTPETLKPYEKLLASVHGIEVRRIFGAAYSAFNGSTFTMISKYGVIGIRPPESARSAFLKKCNADVFRADQAWPPNREYVAVPDELLEHTALLRPYLQSSYDYVQTLRPKVVAKK